jgi:hypothetical protein
LHRVHTRDSGRRNGSADPDANLPAALIQQFARQAGRAQARMERAGELKRHAVRALKKDR